MHICTFLTNHIQLGRSASDSKSQDIRVLKKLIVEYAEDALGHELCPRIRPSSNKNDWGYDHPDFARLLVPASRLPTFIEDPVL